VGSQKLVATPVRRSTRRSCATLPPSLRDHDVIVESMNEVTDVTSRLLFRDNRALQLAWDNDDVEANVRCLVPTA